MTVGLVICAVSDMIRVELGPMPYRGTLAITASV